MEGLLCPWETSFWFFSENVPQLLYYSHIPSIIAALVLGTLVFVKNRSQVISKLLTTLLFIFTAWAILNILLWATNRADIVMFWWSLVVIIEPVIYAFAFYLFYLFTTGRYPSRSYNLMVGLVFIPLIVLLPTKLNLVGVNLFDCAAIEGPLALYYSYIIEALFTLSIAIAWIRRSLIIQDKTEKTKIHYFAIGLLVFLAAFTSGNIIGSLTGNWDIAQFGLFGMPIFIGFLAYLIVQYKAFNLKVFGAQALILALWLLIGSLLFVVQSDLSKIISLITLAISIGFGFTLIRSVKKEVEQRERLEKITQELAAANNKLKELDKLKDEFLSFASHDLKSPVAKMKQWASLIYDKTYSTAQQIEETAFKITTTADRAIRLVDEFLNIRKLEEGRMEYNFEEKDVVGFVSGIVSDFQPIAKQKGLELSIASPTHAINTKIDSIKFRQVIENIIDNSLKYTEKGFVKVAIGEEEQSVLLTVSDSGAGIAPEVIATLFTQFRRDPNVVKTIKGTGLGLYIAKQIILAHKGQIWAESQGVDKGSSFFVRIPKV